MSYFLILFMGIKKQQQYNVQERILLQIKNWKTFDSFKKKFCQKRGDATVRTAPLWCGLKCVSGPPVVTYIASIAQLWPGYRHRKLCYKNVLLKWSLSRCFFNCSTPLNVTSQMWHNLKLCLLIMWDFMLVSVL